MRTGFAHVLVALEVVEDQRRVRGALPGDGRRVHRELDARAGCVGDVAPLRVRVVGCWSQSQDSL